MNSGLGVNKILFKWFNLNFKLYRAQMWQSHILAIQAELNNVALPCITPLHIVIFEKKRFKDIVRSKKLAFI